MSTVELIFSILKERRINQKTFASAIGASQGNVTDWKKGRSNPSTEVLSRIASYLNVSVDYLLGQEPSAGMELSPDEEEFLSLFRQLDPVAQKKIEDYAHDLIASGKYTSSTPTASGE